MNTWTHPGAGPATKVAGLAAVLAIVVGGAPCSADASSPPMTFT
jgi:hypothetical protein